ncbi:hypothetical protein [uncultured Legionella sp.]|uniref:hypothetical protein n=1 Tax=uncultured Legionella sp. TaxID=210934 RepID=UPI00262E60AE|nr:hypothetical protein [uncultured Legionella sp.]
MPQIIEIEMDDSNFTFSNDTDLVTHGISTCIAFIIYASFFDEDDELIQARGLFHWSGFSLEQENPEQETYEVFNNFLAEFREAFDLAPTLKIQISSLMFIGGEKAEWEGKELILSGTEHEVSHLIKAVKMFDFSTVNFEINPANINHYHFLTSGDEILSIKVKKDQCIYTKEDESKDDCDYDNPNLSLS